MIKYYPEIIQGSDEWLAVRCGLLTASEMRHIVTPTLKIADNEKTRSHLYELLAQRVSQYVEPQYISYDMLRGQEDEVEAKIKYEEKYEKLTDVGFMTNDKWGFTLGFSPDGLAGIDGFIEIKSRMQKYQVETIIDWKMPVDFMLQVQTGYLVTELERAEFISYSGGLPMAVIPVPPDKIAQEAILDAASAFEKKLYEKMIVYKARLEEMKDKLIPTERKIEQEIVI